MSDSDSKPRLTPAQVRAQARDASLQRKADAAGATPEQVKEAKRALRKRPR